ncbi:hypothetical protein J7355_03530 [Endozoicomonas sp. G2_2]|uniref:hypothetical protein n=1 Tax=Endozoicomonas sp. G2_2 TaxID=2821092 RepID=UPI001ADA3C7D|nr:hypothetical protein [Endozoicomonas sp. G2_2]MBO9469163.1 hypothetical protein [Endozoicomonas sp. G2_2]
MSTHHLNRKNAFVVAVLAFAGFAGPAVAADNVQSHQDNVTPLSASQSAMLRHGARADANVAAADPAHENVPATRSQIEVLDLGHVRHARMTLASQ